MIEKRAFWTTSILLLLSLSAFGQVSRKDLIGEWTTNNKDSLYFKADTIQLHQDANFRYGIETCSLIDWKVERQKFRILHLDVCGEPGTTSFTTPGEKLRLKKRDGKQILQVKKHGLLVDSFLILNFQEYKVNRYPWEIKVLKLKRI